MKISERSGNLLAELVPTIKKTTELVQEVSAASNEQSSGVSQINRAMSQVDQVTQQNASAAEELASTAEEMASQAESLQQLMGFFQLGDIQDARLRRTQPTLASRTAVAQSRKPAPQAALRVTPKTALLPAADNTNESETKSEVTVKPNGSGKPLVDRNEREFVQF